MLWIIFHCWHCRYEGCQVVEATSSWGYKNVYGEIDSWCYVCFCYSYPNWFHYSVVTDAWSVGGKAMHCEKTWAIRKHCIVGGLDQSENSVLWEIWSNQKAMHYRKFGVVRKQCILGKLNQSQHSVSWEIWSNQKAMPRGKTIKAISEQCIVGRLINFLNGLLILAFYSSSP